MFKTALVTGSTSGIGEALCYLLAEKKINLIITGRDQNKLNALSRVLSNQVEVTSIKADLINEGERKKVIEAIHHKVPDLVINNAGVGLHGEIFKQLTSQQMDVMDINANVVLQLTLEAAKTLKSKQKRGVILNISSAASMLKFPCLSIYSATKAFVNQLSCSLDEELNRYGIRVLCSCPGMVRTEFRKRSVQNEAVPQGTPSMAAKEAAEHIWWQIERGKQFYIFNWKYRWSIIISKYLIPNYLLMRVLRRSAEQIQ